MHQSISVQCRCLITSFLESKIIHYLQIEHAHIGAIFSAAYRANNILITVAESLENIFFSSSTQQQRSTYVHSRKGSWESPHIFHAHQLFRESLFRLRINSWPFILWKWKYLDFRKVRANITLCIYYHLQEDTHAPMRLSTKR